MYALEKTADAAQKDGLETSVGGSLYDGSGMHVGSSEIIGVTVALPVLVVAFGSMPAAGLSLLPPLTGVGVG